MKVRKLKSMIQFILDIDWMTTKEFCENYGIPLPVFTRDVKSSADNLLQIDAIKQNMFVEYAKFLNKNLTMDMFEGDRKIFEGGKYINRQPSTSRNTYEIKGYEVFVDMNTASNVPIGRKVSDLVNLDINYNDYQ